jgi:hypothetical protein
MEDKNYSIRFEVFHGVHYGIPGCPITESYNHELKLKADDDPYLKVAQYLTDTGLFPTESGYLKAKISEISDGKKVIKDNKMIKISGLELVVARRLKEKLK